MGRRTGCGYRAATEISMRGCAAYILQRSSASSNQPTRAGNPFGGSCRSFYNFRTFIVKSIAVLLDKAPPTWGSLRSERTIGTAISRLRPCCITDLRYRYISLVAASCMVLYGYDASVYNAVQGSKNWVAYFGHPVCRPLSVEPARLLTLT